MKFARVASSASYTRCVGSITRPEAVPPNNYIAYYGHTIHHTTETRPARREEIHAHSAGCGRVGDRATAQPAPGANTTPRARPTARLAVAVLTYTDAAPRLNSPEAAQAHAPRRAGVWTAECTLTWHDGQGLRCSPTITRIPFTAQGKGAMPTPCFSTFSD